MQGISRATPLGQEATSHAERLKDFMSILAVVAVTAALYGLLFNRESTLSFSIGYNLYGAERVLAGEIPYRDFHTLYPPATVYVNAVLFKVFGISLRAALLGVLVFKILTAIMIYCCGREVMPRAWALSAAGFSLLWLRPNGPFKAIPMHYGALFLAIGLYLLLRFAKNPKNIYLIAAGVALGVLTLFKHNIGIYSLIGATAFILMVQGGGRLSLKPLASGYRKPLILLAGFALPLVPVVVYMLMHSALVSMTRTLLFGPGEFLVGRLASAPSPVIPLALTLWVGVCFLTAFKLKASRPASIAALMVAMVSVSAFLLGGDESAINKLIFYAPAITLVAATTVLMPASRIDNNRRAPLFAVTAFAAAAFMESFPRFAREQSIGAMPFLMLLLFHLLYALKPAARDVLGDGARLRLALALVPLAFLLIAARLLFVTYFDDNLHFKSDTELTIGRGRGVYFPSAKAKEIDEVAHYIQQRVPGGGYFFAQSYAGSSFLFLSERRNPSSAQFWGGVGVSDSERAETLQAVDQKGVSLIVTSEKDLAAEGYAPMRDYIERNFKLSKQFGDVIILER